MSTEEAPRAVRSSPQPLSETVRRQMSAMPTRDTATEMALRRELHKRGLRFRVQARTLPGRPDIAFTRARIAVFVDGCFWHRCPAHGTSPQNNGEWWAAKLDANVARDRRKDEKLRDLGWLPVHVWEHDDPADAADTIHALWRSRLQPAVGIALESARMRLSHDGQRSD
jgi:DNA mismatch endonuclease (patch repair protein)